MIKKLIVEEFTVEEDDVFAIWKPGEKYSHFLDPETGQYYRPTAGFVVTATDGTNLADLFVPVT